MRVILGLSWGYIRVILIRVILGFYCTAKGVCRALGLKF